MGRQHTRTHIRTHTTHMHTLTSFSLVSPLARHKHELISLSLSHAHTPPHLFQQTLDALLFALLSSVEGDLLRMLADSHQTEPEAAAAAGAAAETKQATRTPKQKHMER